MLTFYGENINNVLFKIRFKRLEREIPPNTAAFSINDGVNEHVIELASDFKKSELVILEFVY